MKPSERAHIETRVSGIWQTNSIVVSAAGDALVVDPAFFPRELDELSALVRRLTAGGAGSTTVAFTHGHWDHVAGWRRFPGAQVVASAELARAVEQNQPTATENLAQLREYEGRWYVQRASPAAWPDVILGLADGDRFQVGPVSIEALALPGHSADGLGLLIPEEGLLLPGDHLSPCEIPFVEDLDAYRTTLIRLRGVVESLKRVIPGHGPELDRGEAEAVLEADLAYLDALSELAASGDVAGAISMPLPRAATVPDMMDRHRENCQASGLAITD